MSTILVLNSSALGANSVSKALVQDAVAGLRTERPDARIVTRDLGAQPVPHLDADSAPVIRGAEPENAAQQAALALSNTLIDEIKAADTLVIGAPMYNFGMATTLKSWFDYVLRAGIAFRYSEKGPEGLMTGKRAIVIESRGGFYSEGPAAGMDSQESHLRTLLGFMGITDITFVRAEKLAFGPEAREQAITAARAEARLFASAGQLQAA